MSTADFGGAFGANEWLVEEMYEKYIADPASVDPQWIDFFAANAHLINGNGSANSLSKINEEADCTITISAGYLLDVLHERVVPMFVMNKEVDIRGNIGVAMKIQALLA